LWFYTQLVRPRGKIFKIISEMFFQSPPMPRLSLPEDFRDITHFLQAHAEDVSYIRQHTAILQTILFY
jgi:hypothetical protein